MHLRRKVLESLKNNQSFEEAKETINGSIKDEVILQFNKYNTFNRNIFTLTDYFDKLVPQISFSQYCTTPGYVSTEISRENKITVRDKDKKEFTSYIYDWVQMNLDKTKKYLGLTWLEYPYISNLKGILDLDILSLPIETHKIIENKFIFDEILKASKIPDIHRLKTNIYTIGNVPSFYQLQKIYGEKFVVQVNSSGGKGTFIIRDSKEFTKTLENIKSDTIKVSEYFRGFSSNTTVLSIPKLSDCEIYIDIPSIKPMGSKEMYIRETSSIGNSWSFNFNESQLSVFIESITRIGKFLYKRYGLVGLWGIDSIWNEENFVFNEINCRLQGTTEVSNINQFLQGYVPFYITHILIMLNNKIDYMPEINDYTNDLIKMATTKNRISPFYIKKVSNKTIVPNKNYKGSGVYKLRSTGKLDFQFPSLNTLDANWDKDEVLLVNGPLLNSKSKPGTKLMTIEGIFKNNNVFENNQLSEKMKIVNKAVDDLFEECVVK